MYIFGKRYVDEEIISWLVILIAAPLFFMGFFKMNGMNFESFAKEWFDFYFGIQRRKYEYEPIYCELRKGYLAEDLNTEKIERIAELKQRKKDRKMNKRQQKKDKKKKG